MYLSLEDNLLRLQNRIYELTNELCENLNFAIESKLIGNGFEEQIENTKQTLPDLKIVVIDTLQKIRSTTDINYGSDYKELSILKNIADKLKIAILLVHHTRKCYDSDPFNMVSGSTGIIGSVMVLIEEKRGSRKAKLHYAGRDIENLELNIEFSNHRWNVVDNVPEQKPNLFSFAIHDFMLEQISFSGSPIDLCKLLYEKFNMKYFPNRITRDLVQHTNELAGYGVDFRARRSHGFRILELTYNRSGDSSDGSLMWSEVTDSAVTRNSENFCIPLITLGDSNSHGDSNCRSG